MSKIKVDESCKELHLVFSYESNDGVSGSVTVFHDGDVGIELDDPTRNVIPVDVIKKVVTALLNYGAV